MLFSLRIFSQGYQWAFQVGGGASGGLGADAYTSSAKLDASNNVYLTGFFTSTDGSDFDPGAGIQTLTSAGADDIYIASYTTAGAYRWAFSMGGAGSEDGNSISIDGSGNIYVVGDLGSANVDFDPGAGSSPLSAIGTRDVFLAKYNSSGVYQWAFNVGAAGILCQGMKIAVDASGNSYITGKFSGTVDFDPSGTTNNLVAAATDIFVARYNSSGAFQWAFNIGGAQAGIEKYAIALDASGSNLYVGGSFKGSSIDFDPSTGSSTLSSLSSGTASFIAKYDATLTPSNTSFYKWAFKIDAGTTASTEKCSAIVVDASGNIYITGAYNSAGLLDFDPSSSTHNLTTTTASDIYVASYNGTLDPANTSFWRWSFQINASQDDFSNAIAVDGTTNSVLVTGGFSSGSTVDFDPGGGVANLTAAGGNYDAFLAKYKTADGAYQCAFCIGCDIATAAYSNVGMAVAANSSGCYVAGRFMDNNADCDPSGSFAPLAWVGGSTPAYDGFVAKYLYTDCNGITLPVELLSFSGTEENGQVKLTWVTASEINNDYFSIERSSDGKTFEEAAKVKGAGNSSTQKKYEFIDESPYSPNQQIIQETIYYRLKQVDYDGRNEYYSAIAVRLVPPSEWDIIFQNPAVEGRLKGTLLLPSDEELNISVIDLQGRIIKAEKISGAKGSNFFKMSLEYVQNGMYLLKVYNDKNNIQKKFIKQ